MAPPYDRGLLVPRSLEHGTSIDLLIPDIPPPGVAPRPSLSGTSRHRTASQHPIASLDLTRPFSSYPHRIRDYWHRPDEVLAGLVLGAAFAHWSFRFVVLMPFSHEVGSPQWVPKPRWVSEEEGVLRGLGDHEHGRGGYPVKGRDRQARRGEVADDSVPTPTGKAAPYDQVQMRTRGGHELVTSRRRGRGVRRKAPRA